MDWDERYSEPGYAYGTEPNDFLVAWGEKIPKGPVLSLAEGEGRNAAWLLDRGYPVTAVDSSAVGLEKAAKLAQERGHTLTTHRADLAAYTIEEGAWAGVVSIFCHLPPALRAKVHAQIVRGLRPGGALLLEAYIPAQLAHGTGGPPMIELMYSLDMLKEDFAGLDLVVAHEIERDIHEGKYHHGKSAVVQLFATKPG